MNDGSTLPHFHDDLATEFGVVRRRLGAIVERVCGGSPKAQNITDRFGVYRKLGWQIWNVVYGDDALASIQHLPNARTLKVWSTAARKAGVPTDELTKLDLAIAQFHRNASNHAEDRVMLDMLVDSQDAARDEDTQAKWRKPMFHGNAYVWGVRAKTTLASAIFYPSARADYFDMVRIKGLLGFVRHRANVRWPLSQMRVSRSTGQTSALPNREALVKSKRSDGVPLIEEFCSEPLPVVQRRPSRPEVLEDELLPGHVGQRGAIDVVTGEILREVGPYWMESPGETITLGTDVRTPSELLISDQLVHRDLFPINKCELEVYGELIAHMSRDERDRIPVAEKVQHLGRASDGIETAEIPRYREMIDLALRSCGHSADEFEVYRVRMRFPPMPVSVILRHQLATKPS